MLKSWAVPKGPSLDPGDKRLAVQVEDHPVEYGSFEGTIPKGQYGGGSVLLWDRGTWTPIGDAREGLRRGNLEFELRGKKLQGRWALIRIRGRGEEKAKKNWLLIKEREPGTRASKPAPRVKAIAIAGIALSHPRKVLYPEQGLSKLDLARYVERVSKLMLPHVEGRPRVN